MRRSQGLEVLRRRLNGPVLLVVAVVGDDGVEMMGKALRLGGRGDLAGVRAWLLLWFVEAGI